MNDSKKLSPIHPHPDPAEESDAVEEEGLSLEELRQTYSSLLGKAHAAAYRPGQPSDAEGPDAKGSDANFEPNSLVEQDRVEAETCPVTPRSILEAMLFVGRPDSSPITAAEIAGLMRGVRESEVVELIAQLNRIYEETDRATRIVASGAGYRLQLADDLGFIRDRFYGRVREVRLNQAAIDCLALVSYQPGISREQLEEQRGQPSGSVLNQLVRRQLLEMRREKAGKEFSMHYYPTDRLLQLAGMASLDDLPQTEDFE